MTSGTIRNSVKLSILQNKWEQKKNSGNALSKTERNAMANWTPAERMKHEIEEQNERDREAKVKNAIDGKIMAGGTLTPEEEQYLAKKDPVALQKYHETKMEKKAYEDKLKNCKTKDEVERLKTNTMSGYLASFKKIENDPYIPISTKLEKAQEMLAKTRNMEEAEHEFKASAEYEEMPTEAEVNEERVEEAVEQFHKVTLENDENVSNETEKSEVAESKNEDKEIDYKAEMEKIYARIEFNNDMDERITDISNRSEKAEGNHISITI